MKRQNILKIISVCLVVMWMVLVFLLSHQVAGDSSKTSGAVIRRVITLFNSDISEELLEQRVEQLQFVVRKLAHFTLYTIGGILITIMFFQYKDKIKHTKAMSIILGMIYAISDEIHQLCIPGRSGEIRDVIIDTSGVILGVIVISFLVYIKEKLKLAQNRKKKLEKIQPKKVLFTATVDSHILHFHIPFLKMFKENGYEVHVATSGDEKIPYCDKKHKISFERNPIKLNNIKAIKQLKAVIDNEKFDMIHCHTPMGGVVTRIAAIKARKNGTRVIYTAHGFHFYKGAPKINWIVFYPIEKWLSRYTDTLITINSEDYELAKEKFHSKQIELVHGVGVDPEKFNFEMTDQEKQQLRDEFGIMKDDFVMIYPAELSRRKNQGMLLRCMKELTKENKNIKLLLPGLDSMDGYYHRMAKELGVEENVKFLGYRIDIPKLLKISNLALSAAKQEGLPVNIMEAMLCGLPAVVTNCRGNRDLIENGVNGYIVEIDDVCSMITCIKKSFENIKPDNKYLNLFLIDNIYKDMNKIYFSFKSKKVKEKLTLVFLIEKLFEKCLNKMRIFYLKLKYGKRITIGKNVIMRKKVNIEIRRNGYLEIGDNTFFNNYCSINCLEEIKIGSNNIFGESVKIYDHDHFFNNEYISISEFRTGRICIGDDNWFGSNIVILRK